MKLSGECISDQSPAGVIQKDGVQAPAGRYNFLQNNPYYVAQGTDVFFEEADTPGWAKNVVPKHLVTGLMQSSRTRFSPTMTPAAKRLIEEKTTNSLVSAASNNDTVPDFLRSVGQIESKLTAMFKAVDEADENVKLVDVNTHL